MADGLYRRRRPTRRPPISTPDPPLPHRGAILALVAVAMSLGTLLYGVGVPTLPLQTAANGLDQGDTGLLFATYAGAQLVTLVWAMRAAARFPPQRILVAGFLVSVSASVAFALSADWLPGLFIGRGLHGLGDALVWIGGPALVSRFYVGEERGAALGTVLGTSAAGSLIGPPLGGGLYDLAGFAAPYQAVIGISLAAGLFIYVTLRGPVGRAVRATTQADDPHIDLRRLVTRPAVMAVMLVIACAAGGLALLEPLLPALLSGVPDNSGFENGLVFGVAVLCYGLTAPLAGRLSDRRGRLPVSLAGLITLAVAFALLPTGSSYLTFGAIASLAGVGLGFGLTPTMPALADAADADGDGAGSYAVVFALHSIVYALGASLGPSVGGQSVDALGLGPTLAGASAVVVAVALGAWLLARRGASRMAAD